MDEVFKLINDLKIKVSEKLPASRERSLIITKLDEARLWYLEAIESENGNA